MRNTKCLNWKRIILLAIALVFSMNFIFASSFWFNESFDFRKDINITNTGSVALIDFPIYINISKESGMQVDYDDIEFVLGSCLGVQTTTLDYELEFSDVNHADFWVKIPKFKSGINNICIYYGNSTVTYGGTNSAVWNSNYGAVYHMDSAGLDSTVNNRNKVSNVGTPINNDSYLGYGITFDGSSAWSLANVAYWEASWTSRVHEVIFETSNDITSRQVLFAEGGNVNGILMYIRSGQLYSRWWSESTPNWGGNHFNVSINTNTKYYATIQLDSSGNYSLYLNGNLITTLATPDKIDAHSGNGGIGYTGTNSKDFDDVLNTGPAGTYFKGNIYEMRMSNLKEDDNWYKQVYENTLNHSSNSIYSIEEKYHPDLQLSITSPSTAAILSKLQNETFDLNVSLSCIGKVGSSCENISLYSRYNDSSSSFLNISTVLGTTPMWTSSSNTQSCFLSGGQSCSLNYLVNLTGTTFTDYLINILASSNNSLISNNISSNLNVKIVAGEVVSFNQTSFTFTSFDKFTGNKIQSIDVKADIGNNTNVVVSCESGDCLYITDNFVDGININEGVSSSFDFTCSDNFVGSYSAVFNVTSDEFASNNKITINCEVLPIYGPISVLLNLPSEGSTRFIGQNQSFVLNATMSCNGVCSNVSVFAVYNLTHNPFGTGVDGSLVVSSLDTIVNDYDYLIGDELIGDNIITLNSAAAFSIGDEIMIQHVQNGSGIGNAGDYEFNYIIGKSGNDLTLENSIKYDYGSGTFNVINSSASQVIRIPHYSDVTINLGSSITSPAWNGFTGGVVIFRVQKVLDTIGYIDVSAKGYRGGSCNGCGNAAWGDQGEGYPGLGFGTLVANGNGGGGGYGPSGYNGEPGAGGSYGSSGSNGVSSFTSIGGAVVGDSALNSILFGGGAGGGGDDDSGAISSQYVDGAGSVIVFAQKILNGNVLANGEDGVGNGGFSGTTGGGGGGAIWLSGYDVTLNDIKALGGSGFVDTDDTGGNGGNGRIRLDYYSISGSSLPAVGYIGTFADLINAISETSGILPFTTSSSNTQFCIPSEDGSCSFEWIVNATGALNTSWDLGVFVLSNDSFRIASNLSGFAIVNITDNVVPSITLFNPSSNEKFLSDNGLVEFRFRVDDDSVTNNCSFYVDNILNLTFSCNTGVDTFFNLTLNKGVHNWTVQAEDIMTNIINSTTLNFTLIYNINTTIKKSISYENTNQYLVSIDVSNDNNRSYIITLIEFVYDTFMAGSWSEIFNFNDVLSDGNNYGFNNTISSSSVKNYNYSISGVGDYKLKENYIVGGE